MTESTPPTDTTPPTVTVLAFFEAFGARDVPGMLELIEEDVHWYVPGDPALVPWAGERRGHAALREWFPLVFEAAEPLVFEVWGTAERDETVLVWGRFAYRYHGSGRELDDEFVMRFTVAGGLISAYRIFEDSLRLARAYGGGAQAPKSPAA